MKQSSRIYGWYLGLFVFLSGCSGHLSLKGTVTFPDGTPLDVGTVVLQDGLKQGIGDIKLNGSFTVYQLKPGDGLPKGNYKGYITGAEKIDDQGRSAVQIAAKFSDPEKSGIVYDTTTGNGELKITVEKPEPKK